MGTRFIGTGVESTWGTTVAADDWSEMTSESVQTEMEFQDIKVVRSVSRRDVALLRSLVRGDVVLPGNYQDLGRWLHAFYGTNDTSGGGPYTHTFPASTGTTGRSGVSLTMDVQRDSNKRSWRYYGVKVVGMSFSGTQDDTLTATFSVLGKDGFAATEVTGTHDGGANQATFTDASATFTASSLIGWTVSNDTDGSTGTITANTATTITATLSGGTDNDWDDGDTMTVYPPAASYKDLNLALPKDMSVSFDNGGTTICAQSWNLNATWPVDETVCLGSQVLSREPEENDTMLVNGDVTLLFEDGEAQDEYLDFDGTTEVDMQIICTDSTHSLTFNMNKVRITQATPHVSGRERLIATFTFESYFDATATESLQTILVNDDADVTA